MPNSIGEGLCGNCRDCISVLPADDNMVAKSTQIIVEWGVMIQQLAW